MPAIPRNLLLAGLSPQARALLAPHLARVHLAQGTVLYEEGAPLTHAYLPETAIIAFVTQLADGSAVETATVGHEGGIAFVGSVATTVALRRTFVQFAGEALVAEVDAVRAAAARSAEIRQLMMWYSAVFVANMHQLAACNARHGIEQRLSRWLLQFCDRAETTRLPLTQDMLAQKLGVQRTSVSSAANALQRKGLMTYRRGKLTVTDAAGLEDAACECYRRMARSYAELPAAPQPEESEDR